MTQDNDALQTAGRKRYVSARWELNPIRVQAMAARVACPPLLAIRLVR